MPRPPTSRARRAFGKLTAEIAAPGPPSSFRETTQMGDGPKGIVLRMLWTRKDCVIQMTASGSPTGASANTPTGRLPRLARQAQADKASKVSRKNERA